MPFSDPFETTVPGLNAPATGGFAIVADDGADLSVLTRALMVGGSGDVAVIFKDGTTATLPGLAPGVIYPLRVARVLATGTTATGLVGLY